jgi:opacity protein-like surface antigen
MPRFLLTLGCGAILLAGGMTIAAAADLPPPVYVPAAQVFSWTGFYIGANAGYGWSNASGTLTTTTGSEPFNFTGNGFVGGAQMGYNWQVGPAVFGAEADFQRTTISGPFTASAGPRSEPRTRDRGSGRFARESATPWIASWSTPPVAALTATSA